MNRLSALLATMILGAGQLICAQSPGTVTTGPGNDAGLLYASNFGQWQVPQGNTGQFAWSVPSFCTVTASNIPLNPVFAVGTPIYIRDQVSANSEIVTPSAVRVSGSGCSITVTPVNQHSSFTLGSATAGLQEAINYAHGLLYQVILTPDWTRLGGTTAMITAATGNSNVSILDQRTSVQVSYTWTGSSYISSTVAGPGAGPQLVPGLVNSPATPDNTSALAAALLTGQSLLLPNNCQGGLGPINLSQQLTVANISSFGMQGTGWGSTSYTGSLCQTDLNFTGTSAATVGFNMTCTGNCGGQNIENLNILGANNPTTGTGWTINGGVGGVFNDVTADKLHIYGFPQATYFNNVGNVNIGFLETVGTANSTGLFINQWGGTPSVPGHGNNSYHVAKLMGSCGATETSTDTALGFLNIVNGVGNDVWIGDWSNCNLGVQIGGFLTSGGVNGAWTPAVVGGSWATFSAAHLTFANADLNIKGPFAAIGTNSSATIENITQMGQLSYLGPAFVTANGGHLVLNTNYGFNETPISWTSITQTAGGAYSPGTYYFYYEAINPAAVLGGITVPYNSGPSPAGVITVVAGNEVLLTAPLANIANATCYNIYRGTVTGSTNSLLIASCVTGTYTSSGSETGTTAPPRGNIPLAYQNANASVIMHCGLPNNASLILAGASFQVQDALGNYYNGCETGMELPNNAVPPASSSYEGKPIFVPASLSGNGQDHLYIGYKTVATGTPTYAFADLLYQGATINSVPCAVTSGFAACSISVGLPITDSLNDSTSGTQIAINQIGVGTNASLLSLYASNSSSLAYPLDIHMGSTTPGLWMLKMCDGIAGLSNCYGFYNGQFTYLHNEYLQPAAAATNGANVNSPYWEQCGNGYQTVTSASAGDCVRLVVALSNTVNTPTSIWTLAYVDGANLTPLHSIDFSAATSGFKVPYLIPGTIFSAAGTALPTCAAALKGAETVVSDATTPTYMGAYASGGTITTAVICSFNGTTYAWLTH